MVIVGSKVVVTDGVKMVAVDHLNLSNYHIINIDVGSSQKHTY